MDSTSQVLIADDTTLVRWAVRRALNAAGFEVVEAETRGQVLEALFSGSFRLVILSLALVGDGMEDIAQAIASLSGNTALIVLTENSVLPDALCAHPRVKAIEKPFSVTSLVGAALALVPPPAESTGDSISV